MKDNNRIIKKREIIVALAVVLLIIIVLTRYYPIGGYLDDKKDELSHYLDYHLVKCSSDQIKIKVIDGYICRNPTEESIYVKIYDTYPRSNKGKESIYTFLSEGDINIADDYLENLYKVPRFDPVEIDPLTWEENPYDERYWRFNYYSLRETRHLLYAGMETGDEKYNEKLIEIIESFIDEGMNSTYAWDDYHGVAFRTLVLTNTWWKLREQNALPVETSTKILKALEVHGEFLSDRSHYEIGRNHGLNEAIALLVLSENFPDLPNSEKWNLMAQNRINDGIGDLIDDDGVFIENSPYYHFYTLEKYWEIFSYMKNYNISLSNDFQDKIYKMISYGTYVLQPNNKIPLLGASIDRRINLAKDYLEMAEINSNLKYVLTQGKEGIVPSELNKNYLVAGQTIMRSGWGNERYFEDETQIIFDVGPYRTKHSDLDGLSFNLYSNGINLLTDSGLYTYDEGPYQDYFKGTSSHNTIIVDGLDQISESPNIGYFLEGDNFVYQSAQHELYQGVSHKRAILLIGHDLVVIIDELNSEENHEYKQMFHLSPELNLRTNADGSITAFGNSTKHSLTIHQLLNENLSVSSIIGSEDPIEGWCSYEYGVLVPCYSLSYKKHGINETFITILEIGDIDETLSTKLNEDKNQLIIKKDEIDYLIDISNSEKKEAEVVVLNKELDKISTSEPGAVIFFDDGHQSISYIIDIMDKYNFSGNIAVIGKYINEYKSYLFLNELKELQDKHGWDIVSHSFYHQGAVEEYYDNNNLNEFKEDILKMSQFLTENEINSAPNWYIYCKGQTNTEIQEVIGEYYKFARTTKSPQEGDTFDENLAIKAFSVTDNMLPEEVMAQLRNSKEKNQTLFLTFHRIKLSPEEDVGYYIEDFEKIIEFIDKEGIKVKTVSDLDFENNIAQNQVKVINEIPEQIILNVTIN